MCLLSQGFYGHFLITRGFHGHVLISQGFHGHFLISQGFHDVVVTFLLVVGEDLTFAIMDRLSQNHLR